MTPTAAPAPGASTAEAAAAALVEVLGEVSDLPALRELLRQAIALRRVHAGPGVDDHERVLRAVDAIAAAVQRETPARSAY